MFDAANRLVQVVHDAELDAQGRLVNTPTVALGSEPLYAESPAAPLRTTLIDTRFYDGAGRVVHSGPGKAPATSAPLPPGPLPDGYVKALNGIDPATVGTDHEKPAVGLGSEAQDYVYDAQGHLLVQQTSNAAYTTGITRTDYTAYDGAGNLLHYDTTVYGSGNNSGGYTNHYDLAYLRGEGYHNISTAATSSKLLPGTTTQTIDANAHLIGIRDATQPANNRSFLLDAAGVVLQVTQAGNIERQFVVNGEVLARTGVSVDPRQPIVKDSTTGLPNFNAVGPAGINGAPGVIATTTTPNGLDLRVGGYASIASSTATQPGSYTVRSGETLQSIALAVYGDASLWYRIADANGMGSSNNLRAGQVLSLPAQIGGLHNNAGTVTPYDPGKVVGDTSPNLPQPQAHGGGGCGGLGMLVMVVVAVAVTYITAGATAEYFGVEMAQLSASSVAIGAASAAVGSIASQLTGMALGVQQDFSWKQVGMSAVGGAIGQGIRVAEFGAQSLMQNAVVKAAVGNALTQGIGVATGLQHSFQWKSVAASAAGAWAGGQVAKGVMPGTLDEAQAMGEWGLTARAGLVSLAAGGVTALARGGHVSAQQVATDTFGNMLGEALAGQAVAALPTGSGSGIEEPVKQLDANTFVDSRIQASTAESDARFDTVMQAMQDSFDNPAKAMTDANGNPLVLAKNTVLDPGLYTDTQRGPDYRLFVDANQDAHDAVMLPPVTVTASRRSLQARSNSLGAFMPLDVDPTTGLASFAYTSAQYMQAQASVPVVAPAPMTPSGHWETANTFTDAMGIVTPGNEQVWVNDGPAMPWAQQMALTAQASGHIALGIGEGVINAPLEAATGAGKGLVYLGAKGLDNQFGAMGVETNFTQRAIDRLDSFTGQVIKPRNGLQAMGAIGGGLIGPSVYAKAAGMTPTAWRAMQTERALLRSTPLADNMLAESVQGGDDIHSVRTVVAGVEGSEDVENVGAFVGPLIGRSGFRSSSDFAVTVGIRYQGFVDDAYIAAKRLEDGGLLRGNRNTRVGDYVDRISSRELKAYLRSEGISEGPDGLVQMNRWLRDPNGSGLYVRPDVRIPAAGRIYDATVGDKAYDSPQITRFGQFSGGDLITIIRPKVGPRGGSFSINP